MTGGIRPVVSGQSPPLPPIRNDLRLSKAPSETDGSPVWTVFDPLRGAYFQIGDKAFALLSNWHLGDMRAVLRAANGSGAFVLKPADVDQMVKFLATHDLIDGGVREQRAGYLEKALRQKRSWGSQLLHGYLFFRIPLVRPDRWLNRVWPVARRVFSHGTMIAALICGALGLYLASLQWDEFLTTLADFWSLDGLLAFGLTLIGVKFLHEFGHAFMAKRFGCRVHTMGVAFMVMFPMLYTDVSDAWRLSSRRQRLLIGAGGVLVELAIACFATLAWTFLPDGTARTLAFLLATVTWVTTLAVNINPLMRFDGYFLLADYLGFQNLQQRGFAMMRWHLRERLFGFGEAPPEILPPRRRRSMLLWAYGAMVWRFFLFLTIAIIVYSLFIKVLGIFLAAVELIWFVGRPIANELSEWWGRRNRMRVNVNLVTSLCVLALLVAALVYPWRTTVHVPAMVEAEHFATLFPPAPAMVVDVRVEPGSTVRAGDTLYRLGAPDLNHQLAQARRRIEIAELSLQRAALASDTASAVGVLEETLATNLTEWRGLAAEIARLEIKAPIDGVLVDVPGDVQKGLWVDEDRMLGRIVGSQSLSVHGYVDESDLSRLAIDADGRFVSDDPGAATLLVTVVAIERAAVATLDRPALASVFEGPIPSRLDDEQTIIPESGQFRVRMAFVSDNEGRLSSLNTQRGVVVVSAEGEAPIRRLWRAIAAVLIRESGF